MQDENAKCTLVKILNVDPFAFQNVVHKKLNSP
jgi:hypothetical protein